MASAVYLYIYFICVNLKLVDDSRTINFGRQKSDCKLHEKWRKMYIVNKELQLAMINKAKESSVWNEVDFAFWLINLTFTEIIV